MSAISAWLLPLFLLAVWWLWIVVCAFQVKAQDIRRRTPENSRCGVSIFPGFPLFPLLFWTLAALINHWFSSWGTIIVAAFHLIFAIALLISARKDYRFCRLHNPD